MPIVQTPRLTLREFGPEDAAFMLHLLNEPSFIAHINDKGIRTVEAAREYLAGTLCASYATHGFGLWAVVRRDTGEAIGMCGLIQRDWLDDVDLGYALLESAAGAGYAREAARATLGVAAARFGLTRLAAIVHTANVRSIRLLEDLGFVQERMVRVPSEENDIPLYAWTAPAARAAADAF